MVCRSRRQKKVPETASVDRNGAQGLFLDTTPQEVGRMRTLRVMSSEGGERKESLEPKGRSNTGGGSYLTRSSAARGQGMGELTWPWIGQYEGFGDLDESSLGGTGGESLTG